MRNSIDILAYNRKAWDKNVADGNEFTIPVEPDITSAARQGDWRIFLTPLRPVPRSWFPELLGLEVLCLASGGGQQAPIFAAAGANVTVLDNSPKQLGQDRFVAERDRLQITTVEGNMSDLSLFSSDRFDLIVNPVSNLFVQNVRQVWAEAYRVLKPGGVLISAFLNPVFYIFDRERMDEQGILEVKYSLPYSDLSSLAEDTLRKFLRAGWPLEFGHTLEDQIGGQIESGLVLTGLFEDRDTRSVLDRFMPIYIVTRAVKPLPASSE